MPSLQPNAISALTGRESKWIRPRSITPAGGGGKFAPDGQALAFPGNTILCHIDPSSKAHAALISLQEKAKRTSWASSFSFLPPSSFHMTVFEGVCMNAPYRNEWPKGVPQEATRNEVSQIMLDRLGDFRLPAHHSIRPVGVRHKAGIGLVVEGADEGNEASLRDMRATLRDMLGLYPAGFAEYRFHITLAYMLHWLEADVARQVSEDLQRLLNEFRDEVPKIELGPPEFCNFETMLAYTPLQLLHGEPGMTRTAR